jgi:hypothetical protein
MTLWRTSRMASPPPEGGLALLLRDGQDWLARMREFCELLWPPPAVVKLGHDRPHLPHANGNGQPPASNGTGPADRFVLVPGVRRPPLLVPTANLAAATAIRHYNAQRSRGGRLSAGVISFCLANGLGRAVPRGRVMMDVPPGSDTIEAYLRAKVAQDIRLSMYLGPARANRKPVLFLLTPAGDPVAFAKIGVNWLTRELVRTEHSSLTRLGQLPLTQITVPRVLHHDQWRGLEILVLSALPAAERRRALPSGELAAAMNEIARVCGLRREPLAESGYLRRLRDLLASADEGAERDALQRALTHIEAQAGEVVLTFGSWHGDWTPWNMASTDRGLLVWDWERFDRRVPLGFDALHYQLQVQAMPGRHRDPQAAAAQCPESAAALLSPFGVNARDARLTATLYLTELATRYLVDRQAQAGAPLGAPGTWLIPAIVAETARMR